MADDLDIIRQLEEQIGKKMEPIPLEKIMLFSNISYALGKNGEVCGLNLVNSGISNLELLHQLPRLTHLELSWNKISDVSPLQGLKQLKTLDLKHNKISQWPEAMFHLGLEVTWDWDKFEEPGLHMYDNPLETPPIEVAKQGTAAVLNYFKELKKASVRLLQCKLLIVGNGEVGKTTLMKKLLDNNFQVEPGKEETTHGIHIEPWQLEVPFKESDTETSSQTVNLHLWDFGGQDIYHATHQFFLTKRSLYLFVWDARREEETHSFEYWLNILKLLSGQSPVIVVMNKADLRLKHIDEAGFKAKFPNIQAYQQISCLTNKGIQELTAEISRNLMEMPHLRDQLPRIWVDIRDRLQKEKENKNFISLVEYFSICQEYAVERDRAMFLSEYLHDLGVILHYRRDPLLRDTVILNPEWATQAVYTLIDSRPIQENQGSFLFDDLKIYWDATLYPGEKHPHLVRLMEKFELCFNFTGTDLYFVPELLAPPQSPLNFSAYQQASTLHFQYHYDFMPEGIVSRFMARIFYLIHQNSFWKNSVTLKFENSTALVVGDSLNRQVIIAIAGTSQRELLAIIRSHFDHIHTTLNMEKNIHYHEMVPCICPKCLDAKNPALYKYEKLKEALENNVNQITCFESFQQVSIDSLLALVAPPPQKQSLQEALLTAASQLQGIATTIQRDEDSRNGFIALLLGNQGYHVKDQTRWGRSATGKSMGRVDIKIENPDGRTGTIIEAFILKDLNRKTIENHLHKVFTYDPNGVESIYILIYAEVENFFGLWQKYLRHLRGIQYKHPVRGNPEEEDTPFAEIKLARLRHFRRSKEISVYHIFINMSYK